jgi:hypothetical protein
MAVPLDTQVVVAVEPEQPGEMVQQQSAGLAARAHVRRLLPLALQ